MAKKGKIKLPKTVAGVKVPKRLRKSGRSMVGLFRSPLGREVLADALVAAAGAAAATLVRHRPSAAEVKDAGVAVADAGASAASTARDVAQAAVGALGGVVADAARQVLPSSLTGAGDETEERRDRRSADPAYTVLAADREGKKAKPKDKPSKH